MKYIFRSIILLIASFPLLSKAGWEITGRFIDRDGNTIMKRYFIQDNIIKVEKYNLIYTCNLNTGSIILVDPENLLFTKTDLNSYILKIRENNKNKISEILSDVPQEQKAEFEKIYNYKAEKKINLPEYNSDSLILRQLPDTTKLLGYRTEKFAIYENGRKLEEFFLTNEINISKDLDLAKFLKYIYLLEPEDHTIRYMASEKFLKSVCNGLVTRRFIFEEGFRSEWQVNKIEQKNIPAYEFGKPDLCKEVSLEKWIGRRDQVNDKFYDDYE